MNINDINVDTNEIVSTSLFGRCWLQEAANKLPVVVCSIMSCKTLLSLTLLRPLLPYGTAVKHPVPDRVKPSFVIFDIWALWRPELSVRVSGCQILQMTAEPGTGCFIAVPYDNSGRKRLNAETWWNIYQISSQIKSNLFEDTIIGVKQDFKAGKPALTEALNTIKVLYFRQKDMHINYATF